MSEAISRATSLEHADDKLDCRSAQDYTFDIDQHDIKVAFPEDDGNRTLRIGDVWITYKRDDAHTILENLEVTPTIVAPFTTTNGEDDKPVDLYATRLHLQLPLAMENVLSQWLLERSASTSIMIKPTSATNGMRTIKPMYKLLAHLRLVIHPSVPHTTLDPLASVFVPPASNSAPASAFNPLATPFEPRQVSVAPRSTLNPLAASFEPTPPSVRVRSSLNPLAKEFTPSLANNTVDAPAAIDSVSTSNAPVHQESLASTLNSEAAEFVPGSVFHAASLAVDEPSTTSFESSLQPALESADVLENEEIPLSLGSDEADSVFGSSDDEDVFHHRNFFGNMVPCKSNTPPSTSLTVIMSKPKLLHSTKAYDLDLHLYTLLKNACVWLDPVIYWGSLPILRHARGSTLQMSVTGVCAKLYSPFGSWQNDTLHEDDDRAYPDDENYHPENAILNGWYDNHAVPSVSKILSVSNEVFDEAYPDFASPRGLVRRKDECKARGGSRLCEVTDITDSNTIAGESKDIFSTISAPTTSTFAQQLEALAPLGTSSSWADDIEDEEVAVTVSTPVPTTVSTFAQQLEALAPLGAVGDWADEFEDEEVADETAQGTVSTFAQQLEALAPPGAIGEWADDFEDEEVAVAVTKDTVPPTTDDVEAPLEPCLALVKWTPPVSWAAPYVPATTQEYLPAITTLALPGDYPDYLDLALANTDKIESLDIQVPETASSDTSLALVKWQPPQFWDISRECGIMSDADFEHERLDNLTNGHDKILHYHALKRAQNLRQERATRALKESDGQNKQSPSTKDGLSERIDELQAQFSRFQNEARRRRLADGFTETVIPRTRGMVRSPGIHGNAYGGKGLRGYLLAQKAERAERAARHAIPEPRLPFAPVTDDLAPVEDENESDIETPETDEGADTAEPQAQPIPGLKKITFAPIDTEHRFFKNDTPSLAVTKEARTSYDQTNRQLDEAVVDSDGAERVPRILKDRKLWGDVHPNRLLKYAALNTNIEDDTHRKDASPVGQRASSPSLDLIPRPLTPKPYSTRQSSVVKSYGDLSDTLNIVPEIRPELCRFREDSIDSLKSLVDDAVDDNHSFWHGDLHNTVEQLDSTEGAIEHDNDLIVDQGVSQDTLEPFVERENSPTTPTQLEAIEEEVETPDLASDENSTETIEPLVEQVISPFQGMEVEPIEQEAETPELTSDEESSNVSPLSPGTPILPAEFESFPEFNTLRIKKRSFRRASWDKVTQLITKKHSPSASTNDIYAIVTGQREPYPLPEVKKNPAKKFVKGMVKGVKKLFGREVNVLR